MEDTDLYDIALDTDEKGDEEADPTVDIGPDDDVKEVTKKYAKLVRELLIISRSKTNELNKEIENLNLKLDAAGVVVCPHCSHSFKDRHHILTPKYIKVFRKCFRLDIEFHSMDELNTWLHLNELDLNGDGLPTVLPLPPQNRPKDTLKSVGSTVATVFAAEHGKTDKSEKTVQKPNPQKNIGPGKHAKFRKKQVAVVASYKMGLGTKDEEREKRNASERRSRSPPDNRRSTEPERNADRKRRPSPNVELPVAKRNRPIENDVDKERQHSVDLPRSSVDSQDTSVGQEKPHEQKEERESQEKQSSRLDSRSNNEQNSRNRTENQGRRGDDHRQSTDRHSGSSSRQSCANHDRERERHRGNTSEASLRRDEGARRVHDERSDRNRDADRRREINGRSIDRDNFRDRRRDDVHDSRSHRRDEDRRRGDERRRHEPQERRRADDRNREDSYRKDDRSDRSCRV